MGGQFFVALLNPALGLLLTTAFLLLWIHEKSRSYVAVAAFGYAVSALAFLIQDVLPELPHEFSRLAANFCFLLAGCSLFAAMLGRYNLSSPYLPILLMALLGFGIFIWFLYVQPDLTNRIYTISFTLGVISLWVATKLLTIDTTRLVDRMLVIVSILAAANFILRPVVIIWYLGRYESYDGFQQSVYWTTVQVSQALISIMLALNLMVAVALDLILEVKAESGTDRLSGVLNRRGFEERAALQIEASLARNEPVALVLTDIDHFKRINDTLGHAAGDRVIAMFGKLLAAAATEAMVVGRIGGEEFAVLLPGADLRAARLFAESLRVGLGLAHVPDLPRDLRITASFGVTGAGASDELMEMMRRADHATYSAKRAGRDQVHVWSGERGASLSATG